MNNMKKLLLYILFAVVAVSCHDNGIDNGYVVENESSIITDGAVEGELLIKFAPQMENILNTHFATRAVSDAELPVVYLAKVVPIAQVVIRHIVRTAHAIFTNFIFFIIFSPFF